MTQVIYLCVLSLFIVSCTCKVDYSDRARNFSLEIVHFTADYSTNFVISPFAVWTIMTAITFGASGVSYDELRNALILSKKLDRQTEGYKYLTQAVLNSSTSEVSMTSKNFMFLDKDLNVNQEFRNLMTTDFKATIKILDFSDSTLAAKIANGHILNPGAKAANVLTSNDLAKARMILTNVISFKGLWAFPFNPSDTAVEPFFDEDNKVIGQVNMMYKREKFAYSNVESLKASVLEMPYGSNRKYSMLFILPNNGTNVPEMYINFQKANSKDIFDLQDDDKSNPDIIEVKVPRFNMSSNLILNKPLKYMGIFDIFESSDANLQRVTNETLFVSEIVHKAVIEVSESGSSRARAKYTPAALPLTATKSFIANKPFVFFIIEKSTSSLIFGGIYAKPIVY